MSNDMKAKARLWAVQASVNKMVLDNQRDADDIADMLQKVIDEPKVKIVGPTGKFGLLADLGYITVPESYDHATCLAVFKEKNRKNFGYYNNSITDANFPNPTRVLKPGNKLRVRAFKQVVSGRTTSEERMDFLRKQKGNVFVGAQGATHAFEQKRGQLPKGYGYASFDEKDALWTDGGGYHRVPCVYRRSAGAFKFNLGYFEYVWHDDLCLLCFCDESLEA